MVPFPEGEAPGSRIATRISVVCCSVDEGYTWRCLSTIADESGIQLNETAMI